MDNAFSLDKALIGQTLRAAYHDAGTYDQNAGGGGANGCLMNASEDMIDDVAGENKGLKGPMDVLRVSYLFIPGIQRILQSKKVLVHNTLLFSPLKSRESRIDYSVPRYQVLT